MAHIVVTDWVGNPVKSIRFRVDYGTQVANLEIFIAETDSESARKRFPVELGALVDAMLKAIAAGNIRGV